MDKIKIGKKEFFIAKPVFITLDSLKAQTGIDFALGIDDEKTKLLLSDFKKVPKAIALMTADSENEDYDEAKLKAREDYLYKNSEMSDFVKCLSFFFKRLNPKEAGTSEPSKKEPEIKTKMKLLKKD
jgi:hypothetical protein